ncbi:hypothetical protein CEE37_05870 [candidate division LCP-89 bacterium B3_LCP]|uniref:Sigma-54 factor interaction domain-containing protein n=1 Tax=candidate division LCP-89 bacterium B3_LCP TaxID=2012998 RepID=A0A532V1V4_UNCL8|nr:MAG: hypothetical protein CEE37_05870 [candidate division LCP-89 bacterium B3_LCP]
MPEKKEVPVFPEELIREIVTSRETVDKIEEQVRYTEFSLPDLEGYLSNLIEEEVNLLKSFWNEEFWGISDSIQSIYGLINRYATSDDSVLILGATGSGKELIAKSLHKRSDRKNDPFQAINCTAIPETLLDGEMFGHEKGSYTGADEDREGLVEQADKGTLFLDEIGDMDPLLQTKLLRFLNDGTFRRVGDTRTKPREADVRIIAATNRNIFVDEHDENVPPLRQDLIYRINSLTIQVPALNPIKSEEMNALRSGIKHTDKLRAIVNKERIEDIPIFIYGFIHQYNQERKTNIDHISLSFLEYLLEAPLTGGVRELRSRVRRACQWQRKNTVFTDGSIISQCPPYDSLKNFAADEEVKFWPIPLREMVINPWKDIALHRKFSSDITFEDSMHELRDNSFFRKLAMKNLSFKNIKLRYIRAFLETHPGISDKKAGEILGIAPNTFKRQRQMIETIPDSWNWP